MTILGVVQQTLSLNGYTRKSNAGAFEHFPHGSTGGILLLKPCFLLRGLRDYLKFISASGKMYFIDDESAFPTGLAKEHQFVIFFRIEAHVYTLLLAYGLASTTSGHESMFWHELTFMLIELLHFTIIFDLNLIDILCSISFKIFIHEISRSVNNNFKVTNLFECPGHAFIHLQTFYYE